MRLILAAVLVSTCVVATAQKKPLAKPRAAAPAASAWPIERISIEGLDAYTPGQVLAVLGLKPGQVAANKDFEAARQRLLDSGAFDSVGFRYAPAASAKGYVVTFQVAEAGPRFPVRFEGLGVPDEDVKAALKHSDPFFGPTIPATEPMLARYSKAIEEHLASRGHAGKIVGHVEPEDSGQLDVVFRPPGSRPAVARVTFTGNAVVPTTALENALNQVAIGVPYTEARFRQLLDNQIRPLYERRGRVRVAFPEVRTEPDKNVKGIVVTVKIVEGPSYSLGRLDVQGTGLSPVELKKILTVKPSDVFDRDAIESVVSKAEARMRKDGYMRVKSALDRSINDQNKKVDVTVRVALGPRYTFGALDIRGLDLISEPAIRKMWAIHEGQPFNPEYPDYFLSRVKEEGILDNLGETKSVLKTNDESRTVDVTLVFKGEAPKPKVNGPTPDTPAPGGPPGTFAGIRASACYRD